MNPVASAVLILVAGLGSWWFALRWRREGLYRDALHRLGRFGRECFETIVKESEAKARVAIVKWGVAGLIGSVGIITSGIVAVELAPRFSPQIRADYIGSSVRRENDIKPEGAQEDTADVSDGAVASDGASGIEDAIQSVSEGAIASDDVSGSINATLVFSEDWEGFSNGSVPSGAADVGTISNADSTIVTTDVAYSGTHSLRLKYKTTNDSWSGYAQIEVYLAQELIGRDNMELWTERYVCYPSGQEGLGGNRYVHAYGTGTFQIKGERIFGQHSSYLSGPFDGVSSSAYNTTDKMGVSWISSTDTTYYMERIAPTYSDNGQPLDIFTPHDTTAVTSQLGCGAGAHWFQLRFHYKMSSSDSANDGLIENWVDGVQGFRKTNLDLNIGNGQWDRWRIGGAQDFHFGGSGFVLRFEDKHRAWSTDPGW